MSKLFHRFKILFPYIAIVTFIYLIFNYYESNKSDFSFLYNIKKEYLLLICLFCLIYLITESFILVVLINHFKKKLKISKCFFVICATYFFNTFIQFSGLGFRAYYLKKFLDIKVVDFLIISILFIYIELTVFSTFGFLGIFFIDLFNKDLSLVKEIKILLFLVSFVMTFTLYFYKKIFDTLNKIININKIKFIQNIYLFLSNKENSDIINSLKKVSIFYVIQFFILSAIFYVGYIILNKDDLILLSIIASTFTDFSFIFTFTPYAIGISEAFLYASNYNFDLKISEILFLSNIFRLSMFVIYFPLGVIYLIGFIKFKREQN